MESISSLFWLFIIIASIQPIINKKMLESARMRMIRKIEKKQERRIITLIHRQETMRLLGFPVINYIDINDAEQIIRAIRMTDGNIPIDLILHTPGGLVLPSLQIAKALSKHPAKTRVIVPHYAMSGGTLIAMAADEILLDPFAVLGPVDPQINQFPAASILSVLDRKSIDEIDDTTLILADIARKSVQQVKTGVEQLLADKMPPHIASAVAEKMSTGTWTHDHPISCQEAIEIGLPIQCEIPLEYYQLMNLYPQPVRNNTSVEFIPMPYRKTSKRDSQ